MKKIMSSRGFTLIELLVVIAIIGILSGIVLTSLGTARTKAKVASAQASMSAMRAEAELGVSASGTYDTDATTGLCAGTGSGDLGTLIAAVAAQSVGTVDCDVVASAWAVELALTGGGYYCVDSTGFAGSRTNAKGATATVCAAS